MTEPLSVGGARVPLLCWGMGTTVLLVCGLLAGGPLLALLLLGWAHWAWSHRRNVVAMRLRRTAFFGWLLLSAVGPLLWIGAGALTGAGALLWMAGAALIACGWRVEDRAGQLVFTVMSGVGGVLVLLTDPSLPLALLVVLGWAGVTTGTTTARLLGRADQHQIATLDVSQPSSQASYQGSPPPVPGYPAAALLRSAAAVAVVASTVAVGCYLVLPEPAARSQNGAISAPGGAGPLGAGSPPRQLGAYTGGNLGLNTRGKLPDVPVARVPADSPAYWRMNVLTRYTGYGWYDFPVTRRAGFWTADGPTTSYRVEPEAGFPGHLLAPGAPTASSAPTQPRGNFLAAAPTAEPFTVTVGSYPGLRATAPGLSGDDPRDDPSNPAWLALPSSSQRLRDLAARLPGGASDPRAAAAGVEDHLRSAQFRYDLDAPAAPRGTDAIDYFLFESRSGFCEHFASAEVLLLRAKGVPARVATGFAGGEADGAQRTLRASDAHAWVEVYLPDRGWVVSDPTPAAAESPFQFGVQAQRVLGLALLVLVLIGVVLLLRGRAGRVTRHETTPTNDPVAFALLRLQDALAAAGHPCPPSATVADLFSQVPELAGQLCVVERQLYGGRPLPVRQREEAIAAIDAASSRLHARARAGAVSAGSEGSERESVGFGRR